MFLAVSLSRGSCSVGFAWYPERIWRVGLHCRCDLSSTQHFSLVLYPPRTDPSKWSRHFWGLALKALLLSSFHVFCAIFKAFRWDYLSRLPLRTTGLFLIVPRWQVGREHAEVWNISIWASLSSKTLTSGRTCNVWKLDSRKLKNLSNLALSSISFFGIQMHLRPVAAMAAPKYSASSVNDINAD